MKHKLGILFIALLVGIGTNIGHPVTPYYIQTLGFPDWTFGVFFSVMSLGMLLSAPIWGSIGDAKGRRITLLIGCIFYSIGQIMFATFHELGWIIGARFFSGCFSSAINVSLMAYLTSSKKLAAFSKGKLISMVVSFQIIGGSVGNFLGGFLGKYVNEEYNRVLFFQALFLIVVGILIYFLYPMKDEQLEKKKTRNVLANIRDVKKIDAWHLAFLVCLTCFSLVFTNVTKYLDVYFRDIGRSTSELGNFSLIIGIVTFLTNLALTPILLKKMKPVWTCIVSTLFGGIAIILTFSSTNILVALYTFYMIFIMSKAIIEPATVTYISDNKEVAPGLLLGVRQSFVSLGAVIGPLIGGIIYDLHGVNLFYICAFIFLLSGSFLFILFLSKNRKKIK